MSFQRLSGEYIKGYTDAILRIRDLIKSSNLQCDLRVRHTSFSLKRAIELMNVIVEERSFLREHQNAFITMNPQKQFEVRLPRSENG